MARVINAVIASTVLAILLGAVLIGCAKLPTVPMVNPTSDALVSASTMLDTAQHEIAQAKPRVEFIGWQIAEAQKEILVARQADKDRNDKFQAAVVYADKLNGSEEMRIGRKIVAAKWALIIAAVVIVTLEIGGRFFAGSPLAAIASGVLNVGRWIVGLLAGLFRRG